MPSIIFTEKGAPKRDIEITYKPNPVEGGYELPLSMILERARDEFGPNYLNATLSTSWPHVGRAPTIKLACPKSHLYADVDQSSISILDQRAVDIGLQGSYALTAREVVMILMNYDGRKPDPGFRADLAVGVDFGWRIEA